MGRLGIRIANVALFILSCFLAAQVFNQFAGNLLLPDQQVVSASPIRGARPSPSWDERKAIIDRNLFGARVAMAPPPLEAPPVKVQPKLEETKLPLKLLGTTASDDASLSSAAIMDTSKRDHQVVRVGDTIENHERVSVAAIERRRVILQNGARREELLLEDDPAAKARSRPPPPPAKRSAARRRPRKSSPLADQLKQLQEGGSDPRSARQLFSDARLLPSYDEEGQMNGVRVSSIKEGSIYEKMGLADGDVIKGLNGIEITNPSASSKVLGELQRADEFELTVMGANGEEKVITKNPEELLKLMGNK